MANCSVCVHRDGYRPKTNLIENDEISVFPEHQKVTRCLGSCTLCKSVCDRRHTPCDASLSI